MEGIWAAIAGAVSASAVTGIFSYVKWILPRRKAEEAAAEARRIAWDGRPAIPGVAPEVIAIPLRVEGVEAGLVQVRDGLSSLGSDVRKLADRQDEANGTAARTERAVNDLLDRGVVVKEDLVEAVRSLAESTKEHNTAMVDSIRDEVHAAADVSTSNKDELLAAIGEKA